MKKTIVWLAGTFAAIGLLPPVLALDKSVGKNGIDAYRLHQPPYNLIGRKIAIGQVEIGRPGKFGWDKVVSWNPDMNLAGLFHGNSQAKANLHVDNHAAMVAAVMISNNKQFPGVAPGARLYASAVGSIEQNGQPEECLATQHVALQNGGDVRAINFSFGESFGRDDRVNPQLDGNAILTQCIDWSSRVHDVLYVIAGNQGRGGIPIPTDHFNGITTAFTTLKNGQFTKVDFPNLSGIPEGIGRNLIQREINVGPRRAINLVAPGSKISVFNLEGKILQVSGTSFAAPHITASVALLQEGGDRLNFSNSSNWSTDSRRHEVMKAILLNSADKIQDSGDGLLLGMNRTTLSKTNQTWFDSDAYKDSEIPLNIETGAGHLNVFRAYQQFTSGQWNPQNDVPHMGWDYRSISAKSETDYVLSQPLKEGSYVAITLAWDRLVELNDDNNNNLYDVGESFTDKGLNNLNVYLMEADTKKTRKSICSSISEVDSVEHIFCQIPETGRYKIRVEYQKQFNEKTQSYALAWWSVPHQ